jgi:hypothetical protein
VDRILDPKRDITLSSFAAGGALVGRRVAIELVDDSRSPAGE